MSRKWQNIGSHTNSAKRKQEKKKGAEEREQWIERNRLHISKSYTTASRIELRLPLPFSDWNEQTDDSPSTTQIN